MRKNPGSIYFIAFNIANILLIWNVLVPYVYLHWTGFDLTIFNLIYCRFRLYLLNVLMILPPSYLILSSIDRTLITSRNALTRQRSTRHLALWSISGITLLWLLYYSHIWFLVNIQSPAPGVSICFYKSGVYSMFMSYSTMTVTGFLPPLVMAIFGILTIRNFRQVQVHCTSNESNTTGPLSSKDRQLTIMLLFEVLIFIIFSLIGSILFVYTQRIPNESKTIEQQALDFFLLDFGLNLVFIQASTSCYSNFIVSKSFRQNIQKLIWKIIPDHCRRKLENHWPNMAPNSLNITATAGTAQTRTQLVHK
ncbi:unnamed protein product [Rotaria sp. Silwood1]|nr:unnamed protein product [Rotaria sp. Silwood1]CAF1589092.1 unnamed protein product [Rotaria sp. Silwood1]CAF3739972.1 unnamed protein product [Rotaria sp. Silwood1]CAF3805473.1 unnamed protein product [Rotaria sp. Silwood1]CAF3846396.1 unnamed protein product [Rotaria sp. Silwood1]